jgi:hypothetical protein
MDYPTQYIKFDQIRLTKQSFQKNDKVTDNWSKNMNERRKGHGIGMMMDVLSRK